MTRKKRSIVINSFPPMLKVNGDLILTLFEVEDNETVKNKLEKWGVKIRSGYVLLEDILGYMDRDPGEFIGSYKPKNKISEGL